MEFIHKEYVSVEGVWYNFAYDKSKDRILVLNHGKKQIEIFVINNNLLELINSYKLNGNTESPRSIAVDKIGKVYLAYPVSNKIVVLNHMFEQLNEYLDVNMEDIKYLKMSDNGDYLFMSSSRVNNIKIFDTSTGILFKEFPFAHPWYITILNQRLFVICKNEVFVYDINSGSLIAKLSNNEWIFLEALCTDNESNLYVLMRKSKEELKRYLYVYNYDLNLCNIILVDFDFYDLREISDMMIIGKELYVTAEDSDAFFYLHRFVLRITN